MAPFAAGAGSVPASSARSGQIATTTTAVAPKATSSPAIAAIRLLIRRVSDRSDQAGRDHPDDQQRYRIETERAKVPVGLEAQAPVDDHVEGDGGEEPAEDQTGEQKGVSEVRIHRASRRVSEAPARA